MNITSEHIDIMEHTRDRAAGGLYCGDSKEMRELVAEGLMAEAGRKSFVPDPYFRLTEKGRACLADIDRTLQAAKKHRAISADQNQQSA